jgi:TRAP-type mannitol/chloroaromatic compound transport system permease large subunit
MAELFPLLMFLAICLCLLAGYPVAFTLSGVSLVFAAIGMATGYFDMAFLHALPNRLYGTMVNTTLIAVPLFVFMGVMLEKSKLAEDLLDNMSKLCGTMRGGMGISVVLVGMLLAASTGIVGATVVTMGLMSLPSMMKRGYSPALATGTICATGTLGQIIPPLHCAGAAGGYSLHRLPTGAIAHGQLHPGYRVHRRFVYRRDYPRPVAGGYVHPLYLWLRDTSPP